MKVAILAGGLGSRLGEETTVRPKPMVEIGGKPILWHIMKIYSHYGFDEFVVMCGYKGEYIKEYFLNYRANSSDITVNLADDPVEIHKNRAEPWKITLCDTGADTLTGGRIAKIKKYVGNETFMLTYGDGVADIDIPALLECHRKSGKIATLTAVRPTSRFGTLRISADGGISAFRDKTEGGGRHVSDEYYRDFYFDVLDNGKIDLVDIEMFRNADICKQIVKKAKEKGATVKNGLEMLLLQAFAAWDIWQK